MYRKIIGFVVLIAALGLVVGLSGANVFAQEDEFTYAGDLDAPEFPDDVAWLNVPGPLTFDDLEGKIVVLDFWTYGCINCIHIIPDLKRLEEEYPDELVVIGVHSAKFEGEGVTDNIRQIIQRYDLEHPIVNDADFTIWTTYQARAWPSIYLIDPLGKVVGRMEGEGVYETLAPVLEVMVQEYGDAGLIDPTPIELTPEVARMEETPLSFPGKVLVDEAGGRLFIADSGHNRIVIAALTDFEVLQVIGTGEAGLEDGDFASAQFNTPQGMALVGDVLYVADTNNHAIRAIDVSAQTVTRIAGTGTKAVFQLQPGDALNAELRSPWDLTYHDGILYIAMAGTHQLWQLNLDDNALAPFAGNGREDLIDGVRGEAELAQPSGLATNGEWVYFADSESSSIRRAEIADGGVVETLIGPVNERAGRLFEFGDIDGDIDTARLQHPLGVTLADDGRVFFADTYNNKIKTIDPESGESVTFAGKVEGGYFDGNGAEALFDEPGGLDYGNGRLYVADTNNHAIRVINVEDGSVSSIFFPNVTALLPDAVAFSDEALFSEAPADGVDFNPDEVTTVEGLFNGEAKVFDVQVVAPGEGTILVDALMPIGYKLNALAPFTAHWSANDVATVPEDARDYAVITPELPIEFPVTFTEGQTDLRVELTIYWCEAIRETLCFVERSDVVLPILVSPDADTSEIALNYTLTPPEVPENTFDFSEDTDN